MSSGHVIQATPLMMGSVKMYIIIIVTLTRMIFGSPQSCLHYCKQSPGHSSIPAPDCDCSFNHLHKPHLLTANHQIVPSKIKDEPDKFKSSQTLSFQEQTSPHTLNFSSIFNFRQDSPNNMRFNKNDISYNTSKSFAVQDIYDQYYKNFSQKYKRYNDVKNMVEQMKDFPLHLYLDIDLDTSENTSQLEELKNMFDNFKNTENDLLDCLNLHIYIFSKYTNKTKTDKNWDYKVAFDNSSYSEELTEIQNTCGQPSRIIKHSLYQIKQSLPKKISSEFVYDKQDITYSVEPKQDTITQNKLLLSQNGSTSTISEDTRIISTTSSNKYYNVAPETSSSQEDINYIEQDDLSLLMNVFTPNIPINDDDALLSHTEDNESLDVAESSERGDLITTTKPIRTVYNEADIQIPRIITKELSNDTVLSVVDGYEEVPNSDFITDRIISTTSDEYPIATDKRTLNISTANADTLKTNIDKSNLVEIHGSLYVLFGMKQIPARFIQQPNGQLYVAIDGFSFCDQIVEENTSNFISSFCNCIQLQN